MRNTTKVIILAILWLLIGGNSLVRSQSVHAAPKQDVKKRKPSKKIYTLVEEGAEFPGGMEKMFEFANQNIVYPLEALNDSIYGRVTIQVIVEVDGSLGEIKIIKGIREDINEEAIRLIRSMPNWRPGRIDGIAVRTKRLIPIKFELPKLKK